VHARRRGGVTFYWARMVRRLIQGVFHRVRRRATEKSILCNNIVHHSKNRGYAYVQKLEVVHVTVSRFKVNVYTVDMDDYIDSNCNHCLCFGREIRHVGTAESRRLHASWLQRRTTTSTSEQVFSANQSVVRCIMYSTCQPSRFV